ncbi:MAG: hypothetical protein JNM72_01555 [Deltaproteobacteria bacterium]|nr:hypothetical protein [Deltaproteobacteria bacterium]
MGEYFLLIPEPFPGGGIKVRLWQGEGRFYVMTNLHLTGDLGDQYFSYKDGRDADQLLAAFLEELRYFVEREPAQRVVENSCFVEDSGTSYY